MRPGLREALIGLALLLGAATPVAAQLQGTCQLASSGNYFVIRVNGDSIGRHDTEVTMAARVLSEHLKRPGSVVTATRVQVVRASGCLVAPARVDTLRIRDTLVVRDTVVVTPPPVVVVPPPPPPVIVTPPPPPPVVTPPPPPVVVPPSAGSLPPHPRVWMDATRIAHLKRQRADSAVRWLRVKAVADAQLAKGARVDGGDGNLVPDLCLAYLATDDVRYAQRAGVLLANEAVAANDLKYDSGYGYRFALPVYTAGLDWCYNGLTVAQRQQVATYLMDRADWVWSESNPARVGAWGTHSVDNNYFWGFMMTGPAALAAAGDDTGTGAVSGANRAAYHIALAHGKWTGLALPHFATGGNGGTWGEGTTYESTWRAGSFADAFVTAGTPMDGTFLAQSLLWRLHSTTPDYVRKIPFGAQPRASDAALYTYDRMHALFALPFGAAVRGPVYDWLNRVGFVPTTEPSNTMILADELLRFDPSVVPNRGTLPNGYVVPGLGYVVYRQSWTDPNATLIAFESGRAIDQNANGLMIWKGSFWISATANLTSFSGIETWTANNNNLTVGGEGQRSFDSNAGALLGTPFLSDTLVRVEGQAKDTYGYANQWVSVRPVTDYRRAVAYLPAQDVIVVVDRATSRDAAAAKVWRWHSQNPATISGNTFVLSNPAGDQRCHATVVHPTAVLAQAPVALGTAGAVSSSAVTVTMSGNASDVVVTVFQCKGQPPLVPQVTVGTEVTVTVAGRTVRL